MAARVTIHEIAKQAGVSTTTVYKALNGKTKISEDMRRLILDIAEKSGYVPNRSAQALARKSLSIGVLLCDYPVEFQRYILQGCQDAFAYYRDDHIEAQIVTYPQFDNWKQIRSILEHFIAADVDGILLEPGYDFEKYQDLLNLAYERNIPVVTLVSEIPGPYAKGSVTVNARIAGQMAAQFLQMVATGRPAVIFTGKSELSLHQSYISGFHDTAHKLGLKVAGIYETFEQYDIAYALTEQVLREIPDLGGIYVSSYNSVGVCDCLKAHQKDGTVHVIGQDLYRRLIHCLQDGSLDATIFQNPRLQARSAVDMMVRYLTTGKTDEQIEYITPQLVMTSNLECYNKDIISE